MARELHSKAAEMTVKLRTEKDDLVSAKRDAFS